MNLGNWTLTLWLLSTAVHCKRTAKGLWVHTRKLLQRNELTLRFSWTLPLLCLFWRYLWWFSHLTNNTTYSLLFTLLPLWVSLYRLWQKAKIFFCNPCDKQTIKKKEANSLYLWIYFGEFEWGLNIFSWILYRFNFVSCWEVSWRFNICS